MYSPCVARPLPPESYFADTIRSVETVVFRTNPAQYKSPGLISGAGVRWRKSKTAVALGGAGGCIAGITAGGIGLAGSGSGAGGAGTGAGVGGAACVITVTGFIRIL